MKHKTVRIVICALTAFIALTAIGGGSAMLVGADRFPSAWLQGTPFSNYTIPALVLANVVGGCALVAALTILTGREMGVRTSVAAGLITAGYIVVELVILNDGEWISWIEGLYLVLGLAAFLWIVEERDGWNAQTVKVGD